MRIFFSVGEPSGDLHAANLIRNLRDRHPELECVGFGGPKMAEAGCRLIFDLTTLAVMLLDAFRHLPKFLRLLRDADQFFSKQKVDAVVLVDFPGFNWWVARKAKSHGLPVFYYGVPQLWAWAPWRVRKLKRLVDLAICKLPFEPGWFAGRGANAEYVGHPFFDQLANQSYDEQFIREKKSDSRPLLLLLPGSRNQEVNAHWPLMREVVQKLLKRHPDVSVAVGCFRENQFDQVLRDVETHQLPIEVHVGRTPELMRAANLCLACSGSVSLELMYHQLPTIIVYRIGWFLSLVRWVVLRCRYITLVNLMAAKDIENPNREVYDPDAAGSVDVPMPEYLMRRDRTEDVTERMADWLERPEELARRAAWLGQLKQQYAAPGASSRAAKLILDNLKDRSRPRRRAA